jgi:TonB-linked SusC/RagA family outer membrane protein
MKKKQNYFRQFMLFLFLVPVSLMIQAQNPENVSERKYSGTVIDEKGEAVIGASIGIKGSKTGTVTDVDGRFSINAPVGSTLLVSYIGFASKEIKLGNEAELQIVVSEDRKVLDEVVVVGYGTIKKRDITGSVASVNSEKITSVPAISAVSALQGRVPGVVVSNSNWEPGEVPEILIRGKRSINAGNDPLFVIDGIPITGGLGELIPSDIESMEILKDASATAIYGSRGANGVVLITTKQGKEGKTLIDYNGYAGFQTILNQIEMMDGGEYAEYTREAYRNSIGKNKYLSDTPDKELDKLLPMFKQDPYVLESVLMAYDENGNYDPSRVRSHNWFGDVTHNGFTTDHQLNIRGGNAKTNFMTSFNYNSIEGVMRDKSYERYSTRLNFNHNINKYVQFGVQSQFSYSVQERGSEMEKDQYLYRISPLGRFCNDDGSLPGLIASDSQMYNPLLNLEEGVIDRPRKTTRYLGGYYAEISFPVDGLKFRSNFGVDSRMVQDYEYYAGATTKRQNGTSLAVNSTDKNLMFTWENYFTYNKAISDKHTFGITLLESIQKDVRETGQIKVENQTADVLKYYDMGSGLIISGVGSDYIKWTMSSFMGRINYNFLDRYLLTVSARYDGSSALAEGNKWALFPSAAFAWRINEENFLKDVLWLTNLKLRAGYGRTGNAAVSPYQTKGSLAMRRYVYGNGSTEVIGLSPDLMANSKLTWEETGQWNVGFDLGFLKNRINGSIDIYLQDTHNLIMERQLPVVSGFPSVMSNVGSTQNKGVEITINTLNIQNKDFIWSTDWMFSANKEEITELYNGKNDDVGNLWFIGYPINVYYDHKKTGIWQNTPEDLAEMKKFNDNGGNFTPGTIRLQDVDNDYKITDKDRVVLGSPRPKFIAGLTNDFMIKNFDFSFFLYAHAGGILKNSFEFMEKPGRANTMKLDYWTPDNPTNAFPRPTVDKERVDYANTLGYDKADFLRVKNITLGYTIPKDIGKKIFMEKVRLYFSVNNPFIFTDFTGIDPEGALGQCSPSYSSWMFGINISL